MVKFDYVNVIDVEATCYPDGQDFPDGEVQEIIEIGIAVVDLFARRIVSSDQIVVKNTLSSVSPFCTELTGWTAEALQEKGVSFAEACAQLSRAYNPRDRLWISQGNFDREIFARECELLGVAYPFGSNHMNLAALLSTLTGRKRQIGLKKAMRLFKLDPLGKQHCGKDDAYNLARVYIEILNRSSFALR
ncbi:MAG TPA: 3'-5' exonuclease [Candidatus Obscuribacterales bacterium]